MTTQTDTLAADVLVVGAGIAGLQAALDLADQGKRVVIVERKPSIGGAMINLSKVFPTLDCASCITTPRMASVAHHDNIEVLTYAEVGQITPDGPRFRADVTQKPRYVNEENCIGCKRCEEACSVFVPDEYDHGLGARKATWCSTSMCRVRDNYRSGFRTQSVSLSLRLRAKSWKAVFGLDPKIVNR